jgi:hypothetical protein
LIKDFDNDKYIVDASATFSIEWINGRIR